MKIALYEVPVKLKRNTKGEVELEIKDQERKLQGHKDLGDDTHDIVVLSKQCGDHNERIKQQIKATLFANEQERDTTIIFKYLEE